MLMKSDINPFDSQETKPYRNDPRIAAMTDLVDAYQRDNIRRYESILQRNQDVLADPFIAENIDEVTRNMRTKGVMKLVAPYTRFTLGFVAKQLNISAAEVEDIVGFLIVDGKIHGKINQEKGMVEITAVEDVGRTQAMQQWTAAIGSLSRTMLNESDGFRSEEFHGLRGSATAVQFQRPGDSASFRGGAGQEGFGGLGVRGGGGGRGGVVEVGLGFGDGDWDGEKRGKEGSSRAGRVRMEGGG